MMSKADAILYRQCANVCAMAEVNKEKRDGKIRTRRQEMHRFAFLANKNYEELCQEHGRDGKW